MGMSLLSVDISRKCDWIIQIIQRNNMQTIRRHRCSSYEPFHRRYNERRFDHPFTFLSGQSVSRACFGSETNYAKRARTSGNNPRR